MLPHNVIRFFIRLMALASLVNWLSVFYQCFPALRDAGMKAWLFFSMLTVIQLVFTYWLFENASNLIQRFGLDREFEGPLTLSMPAKMTLHIVFVIIGLFLCIDTTSECLLIGLDYLTLVKTNDPASRSLIMQPLYFLLGFILMTSAHRVAKFVSSIKDRDSSE